MHAHSSLWPVRAYEECRNGLSILTTLITHPLTLPLHGLLRDRSQQAERVDARLGHELWVGRGARFLHRNWCKQLWILHAGPPGCAFVLFAKAIKHMHNLQPEYASPLLHNHIWLATMIDGPSPVEYSQKIAILFKERLYFYRPHIHLWTYFFQEQKKFPYHFRLEEQLGLRLRVACCRGRLQRSKIKDEQDEAWRSKINVQKHRASINKMKAGDKI